MAGHAIGNLIRTSSYAGHYRIIGTAQRLGAGSRKRIRVYDRKSGSFVTQLFSNSDGSFTANYLANRSYIVMELDDESYDPWFDPACADRVTPEMMS